MPFDAADLRLGEPSPVPLRDAGGRLMLAAGVVVRDPRQFAALVNEALFTDEPAALEWKRRVAAAMDSKLRQNALLREVVAARPDGPVQRRGDENRPLTLACEEAVGQLDALLREACDAPGADWMARFEAQRAALLARVHKRADAVLYLLVYEAGHSVQKYSSHHAVLTMAVCELAAPHLGLPAQALVSLQRAALAMNVAMLRLQDQLAACDRPPTAAMRAEIEAHPEAGVGLLERAGFDDRLALEVIRHHHEAPPADVPLAQLPPARQLAALLRRVDIFGAKISRRVTREPMSPVRAAREACLSQSGVPDEIGGALLKAVGLYPPGSFVELSSGEIGIVVARGRRANLPYVATLVSASGAALGVPALRDTIEQRFAVKGAVPPTNVRVRPPHDRLLAMR